MRSTTIIGSVITLGVGGVAAASPQTFHSRYPVSELHAAEGAYTAGSFAACTMMGVQGFANDLIPVNWDSLITSSCKTETDARGGSLWPGDCSPAGMAAAAGAFSTNDWVTDSWADTDAGKAAAMSITVVALQTFGSPALVPIYGQADHFVAITDIVGTQNADGSWTINQVKAYDGGPPGQADSGFTNYVSGQQVWGGMAWSNNYYHVLTAINASCDPNCSSDPYWHTYILTFEPPRGQPLPSISTSFPRSPGVVQGTMSERLAQANVWKSLTAAGLNGDQDIWSKIQNGTPGRAFEVNAVHPDRSRWDYFLVPIMSGANAVAFVQLDADDGGFEGIHVPTTPVAFHPATSTTAELLARTTLSAGETLTPAILTWDPQGSAKVMKSPFLPYYEFGVISGNHSAGTVRVPLVGGSPVRDR